MPYPQQRPHLVLFHLKGKSTTTLPGLVGNLARISEPTSRVDAFCSAEERALKRQRSLTDENPEPNRLGFLGTLRDLTKGPASHASTTFGTKRGRDFSLL